MLIDHESLARLISAGVFHNNDAEHCLSELPKLSLARSVRIVLRDLTPQFNFNGTKRLSLLPGLLTLYPRVQPSQDALDK
jgi:hypothetical protein